MKFQRIMNRQSVIIGDHPLVWRVLRILTTSDNRLVKFFFLHVESIFIYHKVAATFNNLIKLPSSL